MRLERFSKMTAAVEKLASIGGTGPLKAREWRIKCRLGWHDKAASAVRHLLYGERRPTPDEAKQIEAAHIKWYAEKVAENARENAALFQEMRSALASMEVADAEFYKPHIEAMREVLLQRWDQSRENSIQD